MTIDLRQRTPIDRWIGGSLSWCTLFNDLRSKDSFGEGSKRETLLEELKQQALFSDSFVIRDADVVNSPELLDIVNSNDDGIQTLIREGVLVFALRAGAPNFTSVNEAARERRADPRLYRVLKDAVATFDKKLEGTTVAVVQHGATADTFHDNLKKVLASRLTPRQRTELLRAIRIAGEKHMGENLRFGDIYSEVVRKVIWPKADWKARAELIALCRAAHVLTTPMICGLPPITADKDILPHHVALITGYNATISLSDQEIDLLDWFERFPKMIFAADFTRDMQFERIIRFRSRPEGVAYFRAMEATRNASNPQMRHDSFLGYLRALEAYLIATAVDAKAELVPWQKVFAQNAISQMEVHERRKIQAALTAVPIAFSLAAHGVWKLVMHTPFPASTEAATLTLTSISPLLAFAASQVIQRDPGKEPLPLARLLAGATRTPLTSAAR